MNSFPGTCLDKPIRLRPGGGGSIFVFNSIQPGMFKTVRTQIDHLAAKLEDDNINVETEFFVSFGPFDNVIRFNVDDFCLVNKISSLPGISSQQIQCAYTIRDITGNSARNGYWKPFGCLTQIKIQNHLMLGNGPEIEEAIAGVLVQRLEKYASEEQEIELMATLGWDEYLIYMRNTRGYDSLFKPILEDIRGLTVKDIEPFLEKKNYTFELPNEANPGRKHLFISTYTTPVYCLELSDYLEKHFEKILARRDPQSLISITEIDANTLFKEKKNLPPDFGADKISVTTRLSIKPGHVNDVRRIIDNVLHRGGRDNPPKVYDNHFCIGRYDVYPWLAEEMNCREFAVHFELLRFSLSGNLKRTADCGEYLSRIQYYNSFTGISCLNAAAETTGSHTPDHADPQENLAQSESTEGIFIGQMKKLFLGENDKGPILDRFTERKLLREKVPDSIAIGLARIFSLFDSCIIDRFVCDSFIDMYPFMQRVREIIDTIAANKDDPAVMEFKQENDTENTIILQESRERIHKNFLVNLFHNAIQQFYRGFNHRYLSSYPMMDKNETGVDFSGRLHRVLSAITGMQNLLLDDLDCHLKKGFNVISTYPNIRIHRNSFNITESNVFHLFQPELFYSMYHEVMHTFMHADVLKSLRGKLNEMIRMAPDKLSPKSAEDISLLIQEIVGDVFLLKNGFSGDPRLFGFWYWLLLLQSKKDVDSAVIIRYLLIAAAGGDEENKQTIFRYSQTQDYLRIQGAKVLPDILRQLLSRLDYPAEIEKNITAKIERFFRALPEDIFRERVVDELNILFPAVESIYPLLEDSLEPFSYPPEHGEHGEREMNSRQLFETMPLQPGKINKKRQVSSIRMFRGILSFIYENRNHLNYTGDSIINFKPKKKDLRLRLFAYRIALLNTLQWESLQWKRSILERKGISFPVRLAKIVEGS